ncbi:hypothetical protein VTP01DRAFT_1815 [Rhizomucor pusillus]|uniref:uncharacterized protein n=1 Tax=Rhizomucor pusillus TaxID=4840 RepID=UPI0037432EB9
MALVPLSAALAILGGFILLFGLSSLTIKERLYLSEASVAIVCGIIFGPLCANFINVETWGSEEIFTREFCRVVIGIQVMAAGVALPKAYLRKEFWSLFMLLIPGMIYMWIVSGLLVWAMIPGLNFLESLMVASCFTPTDPVLANSIVQGKFAEERVPPNVRNLISAESGANDGLGYPFLFLAIYLMQKSVGAAIGRWAYWIMAFQILLSIVIGFVVGYIARKLLKFAEQRNLIDKESFLVYSIALALFLLGGVSLIGSDDLLACFIAGNSFTWDDWFRKETEDAHLMEVIDMLLNLSIFVYIGATMPWSLFGDSSLQMTAWRLVVLAILVLFLRRLPFVIATYKWIPALNNWRQALFTGWFGPIGVGAIFYYTVAIENLETDGPHAHARAVVEPIVYFMVLASVIVHGITVPLFHIGTFTKRTLTKSSLSANSITFRNSQELFRKRVKTNDGAEVGITEIDRRQHPDGGGENGNNGIYATTRPRQTAITIITPDDIHSAPSKHNNGTSSSARQDLKSPSLEQRQDNHEDSTLYLPISNPPSVHERQNV